MYHSLDPAPADPCTTNIVSCAQLVVALVEARIGPVHQILKRPCSQILALVESRIVSQINRVEVVGMVALVECRSCASPRKAYLDQAGNQRSWPTRWRNPHDMTIS